MFIKCINWLDESAKEAVLQVSNGEECIECFSCPCPYKIDETVTGNLECLDVFDFCSSDSDEESIAKCEGAFRYLIRGEIDNLQSGVVKAKDFYFHVNENRIPKDLQNGMKVEFITTRIDVW